VVQTLKQSGSTDTGFKVYYLAKSNFPRVQFSPDPDKSQEQNLRLFKKYMAEKEAGLQTLFNRDELITEVLLKNGFTLNYHAEKQDQFSNNEVLFATDGEQKALICLDPFINSNTVAWFQANNAVKFICLARALDTTKKWNLKKHLQEKFYAI
jgi:adenine-specific DNA-methyltransferase